MFHVAVIASSVFAFDIDIRAENHSLPCEYMLSLSELGRFCSGRATPWEIRRSIELFSLPFTLSSLSLLVPSLSSFCSHSNSPLTIIHASEGAACAAVGGKGERREVF